MSQHTTYNTTRISPPVNMIKPVAPPPQYIPIQQDSFINTSASIPEHMKPFDGLDLSYTPEEYLKQVEERLTFAIGGEPQNNPVKYRSWHNRRMAYIQCSLIGTALDWYTNLLISYKQQWNSFVLLFKKQFSSQKTAYYAEVEAISLMKKDIETVRHLALRVQQLVKKGWCNESASTINLKNNEIFTKRLRKRLKDFAHRRQVKHVSTLLEPSIPFHTLVRHVESEDIANEKIRKNDLALEINRVSIEDDNNNKESEHDHIMVFQSGDPNTKSKPAKNIVLIVIKTIMVIQIVMMKTRDEEYQRYKNQRSRTPQQSFLQYFRSKPSNSQENKHENKSDYSSRDSDCNRYNQNNYSSYNDRYRKNDRYRSNSRDYLQNTYRSSSRQRYYSRSPSPFPSGSRYDNHYQRRTPSRSPYRSPYRNNSNYRFNSRSRYRSRSQSQGNSFRRYNYPYRSPSRPRDYRSRSRTPSKTDNKTE